MVWPLFRANDAGRKKIAVAVAQLMKPKEAWARAANDANLMAKLVSANPRLAANPEIWKAAAPMPEKVFQAVKSHPEVGRDVTLSMLEADTSKLAKETIECFGSSALDAIIAKLDAAKASVSDRLTSWIQLCVANRDMFFAALSSGKIQTMPTLAAFAASIDHRHPPASDTRDCWVSAVRVIRGKPRDGGLPFCAFLLARGLSRVSPQSGELIRLGLDTIYTALVESELDATSWSLLCKELPETYWRFDWNKRQRLTVAVASVFVEQDLPSSEFIRVTHDNLLFESLVYTMSFQFFGTRYLRKVLNDVGRPREKARKLKVDIIRNAIP